MRELRSCDFCADDAVGTFEIVPPELEPTEAEQRRVVLCPDCRERLEALLEPLLARAGAGTEPGSGDRARTVTEAGAVSDGAGAAVESAGESARRRSAGTGSDAVGSAADGTETESPAGADAGTGTESSAAPDSQPDAGSDSESLLGDGITFERDERVGDEAEAATVDEIVEATDGVTESAETTESESESEPDAESTDSPGRPPRAYNKVIRLLRNREFPMKRSAVEELAEGAYDLESDEVEAIVDYAVADGEFVEKRGKLRRP